MTDPINLPPISGRLTFLSAADQYAITGLMQLAVEQNTAELQKRVAELEEQLTAVQDALDYLQGLTPEQAMAAAIDAAIKEKPSV